MEKEIRMWKNNFRKLLGNLPSKIVDSRKCLQLNLINVTLGPNSIWLIWLVANRPSSMH